METAVEDDLIKHNPCRIKGAGKEKATQRRIPTVAQVDALADHAGPRRRPTVCLGEHGLLRPQSRRASATEASMASR